MCTMLLDSHVGTDRHGGTVVRGDLSIDHQRIVYQDGTVADMASGGGRWSAFRVLLVAPRARLRELVAPGPGNDRDS